MEHLITVVTAIGASAPAAWTGILFVALVAASCVIIPRRDLHDLRREVD